MVEDAIASCDDERAAADRSTADPPTAAETGDAASGSARDRKETSMRLKIGMKLRCASLLLLDRV